MALKEQDKARRRIAAAMADMERGSARDKALLALFGDCGRSTVDSARLADLVNRVLASSSTVDPVTRARALGDLLAAYGVDTIVGGVID